MLYVPLGVLRFVLTVSVEVADDELTATGFGLKDAVDRRGRLLALSCTLPLNPFTGVIVTVS